MEVRRPLSPLPTLLLAVAVLLDSCARAPAAECAKGLEPQAPSAQASLSVLILGSYHPGYAWSDDIIDAMRCALDKARGSGIELSLEYLDSMRKPIEAGGEWDRELGGHLKAKYKDRPLDLILCSDQAAYSFLRRWRDGTFGPVQTVFCGIEDPGELSPGDRYAGYDSRRDYSAQLDFILRLLPGLQRIVVLTDSSETGRINRSALAAATEALPPGTLLSFLDAEGRGLSQEGIVEAARELGSGDALLLLDYATDEGGRWVDPSSFIPLLARESNAPIFYHASFLAGSGLLGGLQADARDLGASAARLALDILEGRRPPDGYSLPAPAHPVIDAQAARRFGVPPSRFPPGSVILNAPSPPSFRLVLIAVAALAVIAAQALLIAHLFSSRAKLRRLTREVGDRERETRTILDNSPVGILFMRSRRVLRANQRLADMTGHPREAFIDADPAFLYADPDEHKRVNDDISRKLRDQGEALTRASLRRADGSRFEVIMHVNLVDPADPQKGFVASVMDDTPLRRRDEELAQSRKMQVVGQLAGGVAHDFNNLLGGIMGSAELIKLSLPEDSPVMAQAQAILHAATRGSDLTRKLLTFSRKGDFRPAPFDLRASIAAVTGILERSIDKRIHLSVDDGGEPAFVLGDQSMVENALLNLALNARDAMPDGGRIHFRCRVAENLNLPGHEVLHLPYRRSSVHVSVSDTGIGMVEDLVGKIFEPFFTTKPPGKGTGLGLAAVYGTMESHLGGLSVESEAGHGTTFHLAFPMERRNEVQIPASGEPEELEGHGRILVVDDEAMMREVLISFLESLGYGPVAASSGREGLDILRRDGEGFSAVLLDMIMPDMDGRQVYREIRTTHPDLPVVFVSGYTGEAHLQDISGMGAQGFLQKPCGRTELGRLLKRVLGR